MNTSELDILVCLRLLISPISEVRRDLVAIRDSKWMDLNLRIHANELLEILDKN